MNIVALLLEEAALLHQQEVKSLREERQCLRASVELLNLHIAELEGQLALLGAKAKRTRPLFLNLLSKREVQTLTMLAYGLSDPQIAERLNLSVGTTKIYVCNVLRKLKVTSRTQAALWALRHRIVSVDEAWERVKDIQWRELPQACPPSCRSLARGSEATRGTAGQAVGKRSNGHSGEPVAAPIDTDAEIV